MKQKKTYFVRIQRPNLFGCKNLAIFLMDYPYAIGIVLEKYYTNGVKY